MPEIIWKIIVINCPKTFEMLWKVLRIFVDKNTLSKVSIDSGDPLVLLKEHIDLENIPECYGGGSKEDIKDNPGPWEEELRLSKEQNYYMLWNKEIYDKYFLFPEEKEQKN